MNKDRLEGAWKTLRGRVQERWGELTDDDLDVVEGRRDQLLGKLQERYGLAREEAERQLERFESEEAPER